MKNKKLTLIFIHYCGGDGGSWQWVKKHIKPRYNCVYLTLPGFGATKPLEKLSIRHFSDWIACEIRLLGISNYILIGHGMGGKLALFTAFTLHDLPPSKILLIAPSRPTPEHNKTSEKSKITDPFDVDQAKRFIKASIRRKIKKTKFEYAIQSQLSVDHETWTWWYEQGKYTDITWVIKSLEIPSFVIHGSNDPVISFNTLSHETLVYLNKTKLITFGSAGHLIPIESPRKLTRILHKIIKYY